MLFICGSRWKSSDLGQLTLTCRKCAKPVVHTANLLTGKFTFFFIPCCTLRHRYRVICNLCGLKTSVHDNPMLGLTPQPNAATTTTSSLPPPRPSQATSANVNFCTKCGTQVSSGAHFCTKCGGQM